jgi:hypothetical protein
MGLLDDAIREHLELRRRHGADPGEVERQEQEALGRVRRGEAPTDESAEAAPESHGGAVAAGLSADTVPAEPPVDDDSELDDEPVSDPEPEPSQPVGEPEAPVAPPAPAEEPAQHVEVEALDADEPPAPEADRPAPDDETAGEDVLEETPEFLQETPEHDRLWFEQKPPRDFEF